MRSLKESIDGPGGSRYFLDAIQTECQREALVHEARARRNRWYAFFSKHYLNLFTLGLLVMGGYWFVCIQSQRLELLANNPEKFTSGETVTIENVIDGDELRISNEKGHSRIRLLGIKSFDQSARERLLSQYGKVAVDYLGDVALTKEATLHVSPKGVDDEGRLLGTLILNDSGDDLAQLMVSEGMTLVYVKYPFEKMDQYLVSQEEARVDQVGFWENRRVAARAQSLMNLWKQEQQ